MKSAFELAMERLDQDDPEGAKPLNEEKKQELAEIDKVFEAKIAEKEVFLGSKIATASPEEKEAIQQQLILEKERLNEEKEAKKDKVRNR
ncbi:hypothetical protein [Rubellicoccus peritrichatus]|uniref:Uncharacterized protein n=1 Tax=Rubellicoccus peritrichatus TaxID=3080537 RepID=A0AAQ3LD66_9BACT|nr:hypothetical protein [Puniceicoccus sp. CR14]WOO43212.1 hypothetical protein RZN69_08910 [Puniceicoccus sp. CR14]